MKSDPAPGRERAAVDPRLDPRRYRIRMRVALPCSHEALNAAVRRVMRVAKSCRCNGDRQADLEIALREALANAMIHGNERSASKRVWLRCYGEPGVGLLLAIRDQGHGFDPGAVPDPRAAERKHLGHGRGLFLMRSLMDHVAYRRGGREVVLLKLCG